MILTLDDVKNPAPSGADFTEHDDMLTKMSGGCAKEY